MIGRIILALVLFVTISVSGFFAFKLYSKFDTEKKLKTLVPLIGTTSLPNGELGENYSAYVQAGVVGINRKMRIEIDSLPKGLALENCSTQYNVKGSPKPNSTIGCFIQGIPTETGEAKVTVQVRADGFTNASLARLSLTIKE